MSMIKAYLHERQDEINRQAVEDMECKEFHDQLLDEFNARLSTENPNNSDTKCHHSLSYSVSSFFYLYSSRI